ncbi:hypothetical protein [Methylobacter sp.]|uniref:hypothetical protein n=1 Tax=Methylobacter sp. TaxID=2051955 RepID=UPI00120B0FB7|nr:hypothetical protein [Methylobacter sp.]TAK59499.1 MAG: hypothetical protein EPO18_20265 [Methylobacter sp.]
MNCPIDGAELRIAHRVSGDEVVCKNYEKASEYRISGDGTCKFILTAEMLFSIVTETDAARRVKK